jgi:hypothetical protein
MLTSDIYFRYCILALPIPNKPVISSFAGQKLTMTPHSSSDPRLHKLVHQRSSRNHWDWLGPGHADHFALGPRKIKIPTIA